MYRLLFPRWSHLNVGRDCARGYLVFTSNEQMDNRTKFDTVDNQVMFSFYFSFQLLQSVLSVIVVMKPFWWKFTPTRLSLYHISEAII